MQATEAFVDSPPGDLHGVLLSDVPLGLAWCWGEDVHLNDEAVRLLAVPSRICPLETWLRLGRLDDGTGDTPFFKEDALLRALDGQRVLPRKIHISRPDGSRLDACIQARPLRAPDSRRGAVAVIFDLTWAQEEERRSEEWRVALGHELKGTVHSIAIASEMALRLMNAGDQAGVRRHTEVAHRNAGLLKRLLVDFVDAARVQDGSMRCSPERIQLRNFLEGAICQSELPGPNHLLLLQIDPRLEVLADPDRLQQIVTNLLDNATKYSRPGQLWMRAEKQLGRVVLSLMDEGPGIKAAEQRWLFHRFGRLPSKQEGSGLGLWMSRKLALRMNGDLWLTSAQGAPTTFFLALPTALETFTG